MSKKPTVINIGYGRHLFQSDNMEQKRLLSCAAETEHLHAIIFSRKSEGLQVQPIGERLTLHPTNSKNTPSLVIDAYSIAKKLIKDIDGDVVVHTQDPFETGLIGYFLKRAFPKRVRLVIQEHGDVFSLPFWRQESFLNRVRYSIGISLLERADTVRVVSRRIKETLEGLGVTTPIVELPVAVTIPQNLEQPFHRTKPSDTFEFLSVARFVPQKNIPLMLDAFHKAYTQNPNLRLRLVGQGPEESVIQKHIQRTYTEGECPIILEGWSDSVPKLMQQADAYLLTSNYEGWGRVLIEAMCAQLPIITTDVGCANEVVLDGQHGLIVPVNDGELLVEAMLRLVNEDGLYEHFVSNLSELDHQKIPGTNAATYGQQWVASLQ